MGGNQPEESPALSSARQAELRPDTSVGTTKDKIDSSQPSKGPVDPPTDLKFAPGIPLQQSRKDQGTDKIAKPGGEDKVHGTGGGQVVNAAEQHLRSAAEQEKQKIFQTNEGLAANRATSEYKQT